MQELQSIENELKITKENKKKSKMQLQDLYNDIFKDETYLM